MADLVNILPLTGVVRKRLIIKVIVQPSFDLHTMSNWKFIKMCELFISRILAKFTIIDTPSILGLRPTGVELLPEALKAAGIIEGLNADYTGLVPSLPYNNERDKVTLLL